MKAHALLFAILASGCLYAIEPIELKLGDQPDHLVSVQPRSDAYAKLINEKLLLTRGDYGRMVCRPSFFGEFAVSVYDDDVTEGSPREPRVFHITLTKAKENIYYLMLGNNRGQKQKPIVITRTDVTIDRAFAVAIQRAWGTMLLKTRYPTAGRLLADGYIAEFSVWVRNAGDLYGETWSPEHGMPKEFVELGWSLSDYCESSVEQRPAKQRTIMKRLAAFVRRAQ